MIPLVVWKCNWYSVDGNNTNEKIEANQVGLLLVKCGVVCFYNFIIISLGNFK